MSRIDVNGILKHAALTNAQLSGTKRNLDREIFIKRDAVTNRSTLIPPVGDSAVDASAYPTNYILAMDYDTTDDGGDNPNVRRHIPTLEILGDVGTDTAGANWINIQTTPNSKYTALSGGETLQNAIEALDTAIVGAALKYIKDGSTNGSLISHNGTSATGTVSGGSYQYALGSNVSVNNSGYSFVFGLGSYITSNGSFNAIFGNNNYIDGTTLSSDVILGGQGNYIKGNVHAFNSIIGGNGNYLNGDGNGHSLVGGNNNRIIDEYHSHDQSGIFSGDGNYIIDGDQVSILGGGLNWMRNVITGSILSGASCYIDATWYGVITGGSDNRIIGSYSGTSTSASGSQYGFIGNGINNQIISDSQYGFIGNGVANVINGGSFGAFIGASNNSVINSSNLSGILSGDSQNIDGSDNVAIISGSSHEITGSSHYSVILGGSSLKINDGSSYSIVGGGYGNEILDDSDYASILGGTTNTITSSVYSLIVGGNTNTINSTGSSNSIIGGNNSSILGSSIASSIVGGGGHSITDSNYSSITSGHGHNINNADYSSISAGSTITISETADYSFIGAGYGHYIHQGSTHSFIGSGGSNYISGLSYYSFIGTGYGHYIYQSGYSIIGAGSFNYIGESSPYSVVGSGYSNRINQNSSYSSIGAGSYNNIGGSSEHSSIGAGSYNNIGGSSEHSSIGAGIYNYLYGSKYSSIDAGSFNYIEGSTNSSVLGGSNNFIDTSTASSIVGGLHNVIFKTSEMSSIVGGYNNKINSGSGYGFVVRRRIKSITQVAGVATAILEAPMLHTYNSFGMRVEGANESEYNISALATMVDPFTFTYSVDSGASSPATGTLLEFVYGDAGGASCSIIGNGYDNYIHSGTGFALIGSGISNVMSSASNFSSIVSGQSNNITSSTHSSIIVGGYNEISNASTYSIIGSGLTNIITNGSRLSIIGSGESNYITNGSEKSAILSGYSNTIDASSNSSILNGEYNYINPSSDFSSILNGSLNSVFKSNHAVISNGIDNHINTQTYLSDSPYNMNVSIHNGFGNELLPVNSYRIEPYNFNYSISFTDSDVNTSTNEINIGDNSSGYMTVGKSIIFDNVGGTLPVGITAGTEYKILTATTLESDSLITLVESDGVTPVDITSASSGGTHYVAVGINAFGNIYVGDTTNIQVDDYVSISVSGSLPSGISFVGNLVSEVSGEYISLKQFDDTQIIFTDAGDSDDVIFTIGDSVAWTLVNSTNVNTSGDYIVIGDNSGDKFVVGDLVKFTSHTYDTQGSAYPDVSPFTGSGTQNLGDGFYYVSSVTNTGTDDQMQLNHFDNSTPVDISGTGNLDYLVTSKVYSRIFNPASMNASTNRIVIQTNDGMFKESDVITIRHIQLTSNTGSTASSLPDGIELDVDYIVNDVNHNSIKLIDKETLEPVVFNTSGTNGVGSYLYIINNQRSTSSNSSILNGYKNILGNLVNNSFIGSGNSNLLERSVDSSISSGNKNYMTDTIVCSIVSGESNYVENATHSGIVSGYGNYIAQGDNANVASRNFIGSGNYNRIVTSGNNMFIGGGNNNRIISSNTSAGYADSIIGGGENYIDYETDGNGSYNLIGGGSNNRMINTVYASTILGGTNNYIDGTLGFGPNNVAILNGDVNYIIGSVNGSANESLIGSGFGNRLFGSISHSSILSGSYNKIDESTNIFIGSGNYNYIADMTSSAIVAGQLNNIYTSSGTQNSSFIGAGSENNIIDSSFAVLTGGYNNSITNASHSFIGSGDTSYITNSNYSSIVGGYNNYIDVIGSDSYTTIVGGDNNSINTEYSFIGGGRNNYIANNRLGYNAILIGEENIIEGGAKDVIIGGERNYIFGDSTTSRLNSILSGFENLILGSSIESTIIGGASNKLIDSANSSILGGGGNIISTTANLQMILNSGSSTIDATGTYNSIIGSGGSSISGSSNSSAIIGSGGNVINNSTGSFIIGSGSTIDGFSNSVILGSGITASRNNHVYARGLTLMEGREIRLEGKTPNIGDVLQVESIADGEHAVVTWGAGATAIPFYSEFNMTVNGTTRSIEGSNYINVSLSDDSDVSSYNNLMIGLSNEGLPGYYFNDVNETTYANIVNTTTGNTPASVVESNGLIIEDGFEYQIKVDRVILGWAGPYLNSGKASLVSGNYPELSMEYANTITVTRDGATRTMIMGTSGNAGSVNTSITGGNGDHVFDYTGITYTSSDGDDSVDVYPTGTTNSHVKLWTVYDDSTNQINFAIGGLYAHNGYSTKYASTYDSDGSSDIVIDWPVGYDLPVQGTDSIILWTSDPATNNSPFGPSGLAVTAINGNQVSLDLTLSLTSGSPCWVYVKGRSPKLTASLQLNIKRRSI